MYNNQILLRVPVVFLSADARAENLDDGGEVGISIGPAEAAYAVVQPSARDSSDGLAVRWGRCRQKGSSLSELETLSEVDGSKARTRYAIHALGSD